MANDNIEACLFLSLCAIFYYKRQYQVVLCLALLGEPYLVPHESSRAKYKVFASKFADCRDEWELSFFQQCKAFSIDIPTTVRDSISDQMKVHLHLLFRLFGENSDNYHMINTQGFSIWQLSHFFYFSWERIGALCDIRFFFCQEFKFKRIEALSRCM